MRIKKILTILFFLLFIVSCVDEFWPDLDKYENLLVVDGLLTNNNEQVIVKLSRSSPVDSDIITPVPDGDLYFTDENQVITRLYETSSGIYMTVDSSFTGQAGNAYQLHINLPNGKSYISDICELPDPSPIDSVYGVIEYPDSQNNNHNFPGIQFYIENHSQTNDTSYYIWRSYQTYKYRSTFDIDFTWEGELIPNPDATALRTCWHTSKVKDFIISSTKHLDPVVVRKFPLHFVSTKTKMLSIKYSVLVKQLSISKTVYNFYEAIDEQNDAQGEMWSRQPVQILGNMHNIDNPEEPVLGYFIVAGLTEKRIFIDRPQLPFYYFECEPDFEGMRFIEYEPSSMWPIYIDDIMFLGLARAANKSCFDCRESGGTLIPPDFWE